jgi:hypothetical protein
MRVSSVAWAAGLLLGGAAQAASFDKGDRNTDPGARAAPAMVPVGPGNTDGSPRQLVRTSTDVLYVIAPSGTSYVTSPPTRTRLHVWGAKGPGTPTGFVDRDAAHAPGGGVNASASAIDGADRIHSLWITPDAVNYGVFDTATNTWLTQTVLAVTNWTNYGQGFEGAAIAVDAAGNPFAVWNAVDPSTGQLHVELAVARDGTFGAPVQVDDVSTVGGAWHPTVAFAPNGDFVVSWIDGNGQYYDPGIVRTRVRHRNGRWDPSYAIPDVGAQSSLDQSNSLLITADGTRHITFIDDGNVIRYYYDRVDGQGWRGDQQPPTQVTHDPVLGPDGQGGLYIYGHNTPVGSIGGIGDGKLRFHKPAGASVWSSYDLVRDGLIDDASSVRWSQFFHFHPEEVDFTWWNHSPNTNDGSGYYLEVGIDTVTGPILAGTTVLQSQPILPPPDYQLDQQAVHPSSPGGTAQAFAVTAGSSGTAGRIGVYVDATNGAARAQVGVYADAGGAPGALLAQATLSGRTIGGGQWHELALASAVPVTAGQTYWIAVLSPAGDGPFAYRSAATGAAVVTSASASLTRLPAAWSSAPGSSQGTLAAYLVGQ